MQLFYLIISLLVGAFVARALMPRLLRFNSRLGSAALLPAMMIGVVVASALRIYMQHISPALYFSTAMLGCGVLLLYAYAILNDLARVKEGLSRWIKIGTALLFPLLGLHINFAYGISDMYSFAPGIWMAISFFITLLIVETFDNEENEEGGNAVQAVIFLLAIGIHFYTYNGIIYTFMAFSLAGALLVLCYYTFKGDWRIGTLLKMGHSGGLILGFTISYLAIKYAMYNPAVIVWHKDAYIIPFSLLLVPTCEFIRTKYFYLPSAKVSTNAIMTIVCYATGMILLHIIHADTLLASIVLGILYLSAATFFSFRTNSPSEREYKESKPKSPDADSYVPGLVSVIMPTWNSKRFVGESIESILAQNYKNLELIITDDASTDGTPELLKEYAAKDKRIKLILNDKNGGAGYSRNCSIAAAQGQYIAFCDSDDRWTPEKLEAQVRFMNRKNVALCFCPYYTCDAHNHYLGYVSSPRRIGLFGMMCDNKIGFLTAIYDRSQLGKHFMPLQRKRQDHALLLILLKKCHYAYSVSEPLAHYRLHAGNMSGSKIGLIKFNAKTYNSVFGWPSPLCYAFLFVFFFPTYFYKRAKNLTLNIMRFKLS